MQVQVQSHGPEVLFILSPARSFSTISVALLSGHPMLFGFPETLLFMAPTIGELISFCARDLPAAEGGAADGGAETWQPAMFVDSRLSGLARAIALLREESQDEDAVLRALEWLLDHQQQSTVDVMDQLRRLVSPRITVEKTPEVCYSGEALQRCISAYPHSRFLHLTRHPVTWQRSMDEASRVWLRDAPPELSFRSACRSAGMMPAYDLMNWYTCHHRIIRALEAVPGDRWLRVRGEDLLGAPYEWLPRILGWLRLESSQTLIAGMMHTEKWPFTASRGDLRRRDGDWKFFADPALRPVSLPGSDVIDPDWRLTPSSCEQVTTLARDLGY